MGLTETFSGEASAVRWFEEVVLPEGRHYPALRQGRYHGHAERQGDAPLVQGLLVLFTCPHRHRPGALPFAATQVCLRRLPVRHQSQGRVQHESAPGSDSDAES